MSYPTQYFELPNSIFLSCTNQYFLVAQLSVWFTSKNTFREKSLTENIKSPAVFSSISTRLVWVFKNYHVTTNKLAIGINWFANINIFEWVEKIIFSSYETQYFRVAQLNILSCPTYYLWVAQLNIFELCNSIFYQKYWVAQLNVFELLNSIFLTCTTQYFWVVQVNIFELQNSIFLSSAT